MQLIKMSIRVSINSCNSLIISGKVLSHEDSNLDIQNQNLLYCPYTMGQRCAKVRLSGLFSKHQKMIL
jgi:hypothetical protein